MQGPGEAGRIDGMTDRELRDRAADQAYRDHATDVYRAGGVALVARGAEDLLEGVEVLVLREKKGQQQERAHHTILDAARGYFAASFACLPASVPA